MRSRSLLVVLSLLAIAAGPVEAGSKARTTRQKKITAQKRAAAAKRKAAGEKTTEPSGPGTIGGTRNHTAATDRPARRPAPTKTTTASTTGAGSKRTGRVAARKTIATPQHHAGSSSAAAVTTTRTSFDTGAAAAPRKRFVKLKRFFAGLAIVTALSAGAMGWQAADMNSKVGNAYTQISQTIEQIIWGGHDDPVGGKPDKGNPQPPFPDPGPPLPEPDPQPDPGPSPSGGNGHQTPKGPETDH